MTLSRLAVSVETAVQMPHQKQLCPQQHKKSQQRPLKLFLQIASRGEHHYLVAGDRLSGWEEVYSSPVNSSRQAHLALLIWGPCSQLLEFHWNYPVMGDLNLLPPKQKSCCLPEVSTTGVLLLVTPNQMAEQKLQ